MTHTPESLAALTDAQLDRLVAEEKGWKETQRPEGCDEYYPPWECGGRLHHKLPCWSTDIGTAMMLVDELPAVVFITKHRDSYSCEIIPFTSDDEFAAEHKSAPRAIVIAYLLARRTP